MNKVLLSWISRIQDGVFLKFEPQFTSHVTQYRGPHVGRQLTDLPRRIRTSRDLSNARDGSASGIYVALHFDRRRTDNIFNNIYVGKQLTTWCSDENRF